LLLLQSLENKKIPTISGRTDTMTHHILSSPSFRVTSVTQIGVSEAKLVAIMDRQMAHQGRERPPRKNDSEFLDALPEKNKPTPIAKAI
jgi:hypothetical protein